MRAAADGSIGRGAGQTARTLRAKLGVAPVNNAGRMGHLWVECTQFSFAPMHFVRRQWLHPLQAAGLLMTLGVGCVADDPDPTPHNPGLRVSEEVFRMFCM